MTVYYGHQFPDAKGLGSNYNGVTHNGGAKRDYL